MKILVTGGAGFIGSNLVHYLLALEGDVMVVDDLSTGKVENLDPRAEFRKMDVRDEALVELARQWQPEVIVHLAAQISVAKSMLEPELTRSVNVDGTWVVARAALECGAQRVVFCSTAAVYGDPDADLLPLSETDPVAPINPYGESKLAAEQVLREVLKPAGVDFAIARLSNVYGPRQDASGEGGVVSAFCDALLHGAGLRIYGDGKQTRDFIYVGDVVMGLVSMIGGDIAFSSFGEESGEESDGESGGGSSKESGEASDKGIFHLSTGQPLSVEYLARSLQRISRSMGAEFEYCAPREGDIYASVLDPGKALDVFEWQVNVGFEQGLQKTWTWFQQQGQVG